MDSLHDLFETLGGRNEVAAAANVSRNTVDFWVKRQRVGYDHWEPIISLARRKQVAGVDSALLLRLQRRQPPRPRGRYAAE